MTSATYSIYNIKFALFRKLAHSIILSITLLSFISFSILAQDTSIVINEILYFQDISNIDQTLDHEWVEIYNAGMNDIDMENWTISNRSGTKIVTLPKILFPQDAYLIIHFREGIDDLDLSNNTGHYYSQDDHESIDVFSSEFDEIAIYSGEPSKDNIVDFLAWKANDLDFDGGTSHDFAVEKGIWTPDDFFNSENSASRLGGRAKKVFKGTTIGRNKDSDDADLPSDWDIDGGVNAYDMTPNARNLSIGRIIFPPPPPKPMPKEWTFMVYMAADSDLEKYALKDLNELEIVSQNDKVNVVVMVDWSQKGIDVQVSTDQGATWTPTSSTYRGYMLQDNDPKRATMYSLPAQNPAVGEQNMGDPLVLKQFITWGKANFPANKYAVILWDEGWGWKANTGDDTSDDQLHIGELTTAFLPNPGPVDLMGFDQSYMGMIEVAEQVYDFAPVMVASEESEMVDGWPYHLIINDLKNNPGWSAQQLGADIVGNFNFFYSNIKPDPLRTLSAIDLNIDFQNLLADVDIFAKDLTLGIEDYKKHYDPRDNVQLQIQKDLNNVEKFGDPNYIDLSDFARLIRKDGGIPFKYKKKARNVSRRLMRGAGVVLARSRGSKHKKAHGLSIYFPTFQTDPGLPFFNIMGDPYDDPTNSFMTDRKSPQAKYAADPDDCIPPPPPPPQDHPIKETPNLLFRDNGLWDEFLHRYYEPVADAGEDIVVFVGQQFELNGCGSSDADGFVNNYFWDIDDLVNDDADDYDRNCVDDFNDDGNYNTKVARHTYWEVGVYSVTLNVWDNHHLLAGHDKHQETDQDEMKVTVIDFPFIHDPSDPWHDVVSGGAGHLEGEDGSVCYDWTLGEWVVNTLSSENNSLAQGFHQGLKLMVSVDKSSEMLKIEVYPNPTNEFVYVKSDYPKSLILEVFDPFGKIIMKKDLHPFIGIQSIDMSKLPSSLYVLRFIDKESDLFSTYKILKTD